MNKRKNIAVTVALVVIAAIIVILLIFFNNKKSSSNKTENAGDDHYLLSSPTNILCPRDANTAFNNNFIYYGSSDGIVEYDIENNSFAVISLKTPENTRFSCFSMYNGYIYAVKHFFNEITKSEEYSIVRIDYNSGDVTEIYSPKDKNNEIGCMSFSVDGMLYFSEGYYVAGENDSEGYNTGFNIYEYDIKSSTKKHMVSGNTYYIHDGKIFFTRLNEKNDTARLFYSELTDTENAIDTGIDVGEEMRENTPYMYYPVDGKVYYSGDTNKLMYYDLETKESNTVYEFEETSFVRYFQHWNDILLVLVRERMPGANYQYGLYYIDDSGEAKKIIDDTKLNEEYLFNYEWIEYLCVFNGCDDYFLLSDYNQNTGNRAYIVDKEFNMTMIVQDGDWDYEAFEEMQMNIWG